MVLRKRLALIASTIALGVVVVGCSSTGDNNVASGTEGNPYEVIQNINARKAINLAIDTQQMVDVLLNDGSVAVDYLVPSDFTFTDDGKDYRDIAGDMGYKHDDAEAATSWQAAKDELGFDTVNLTLVTGDTDASKKMAEYIQNELQQSLEGLKVEIRMLPGKQKIEEESSGNFQLSTTAWGADFPDPLDFLGLFESSGYYAGKMKYKNEEYDKLIKDAKSADNVEDSWNSYVKAEKLLLDDAVIVPTYQRGKSYLQKDYIKDIALYAYGSPMVFKWAENTSDSKDLRLTTSSDIPSMDISKASDALSFQTIGNTMEGLVRVDGEGKIVPGMATEWEQSEDGLTWTFKLRNDAKWSNGDNVTAKDFEYSWKRTLTPATGSEYAYLLYDIEGGKPFHTGETDSADNVGVKAIDDYTLEVKLARRLNYFDKLMAFPLFYPQNQKVVEANGTSYGTTNDKVVYNGPFTLSSWKTEDSFTMSKNPNYWDSNVVKLENVHFKVVKDIGTAVNLYETGEIDRVEISSEFVDNYKDSPELGTFKDAATYFLMMNMGGDPSSSK